MSIALQLPAFLSKVAAMDVVIAGGHGKIALRALRLLADRGDRGRGLIRNPDHAPDLGAVGAEPVVSDLEAVEAAELAAQLGGSDAVIFSAGAGAGSGAARKRTMDYGGAVKLIAAAQIAGISRYLMVSAIGANHPDRWSESMRPYYQAKAEADAQLEASGLDYTIVRPGGLTDDPGTGLIDAASSLERSGSIPRDDVAATLVACLDEAATVGASFDLLAGEFSIPEALRAL
jgi:uncharacterized protein YbjT (DUF2867 family)